MIRDFYDITFWGTNIPKNVENMMKAAPISFDSSEQEAAYNLGVQNTLSALKSFLDECVDNESITFYCPDVDIDEEMSLDDVAAWLETIG